MHTQQVSYLGAFVAGLLSFLSPCVLPLIPSYITYITGLSFADLQAEHPTHLVRRTAMLHALAFIAAFTLVFVLLGASATFAGSFLHGHITLVRRAGGILIMLFGIHVTGLVPFSFLMGERRLQFHHKPAGYLGSFLVGIAFSAGWTPCIGPILASILMVAATKESIVQGTILLLLYSAGLGFPFFFSALAMHRFVLLFNRFKKFIRLFEIVTGFLLILVGILIFTNALSRLSGYALMLFPGGE
jgi:cytochrome c-type biogenesis protein